MIKIRPFKLLVFALIALVVGFAALWWRYKVFLEQPVNLSQERIFVVPQGSGDAKIISLLAEAKIISNQWFMRYFIESEGFSRKLQYGNFVLRPGMRPHDLAEALTRTGKYFERKVNISAGLNIFEIAERLHEARIADKQTFLTLAQERVFVADLGLPSHSIEGYIAPGSYHFKPSATPDEVISEMHRKFLKNWSELVAKNRGKYEQYIAQGYGDHELLTLASMVEKEAVKEREKAVIFRVFLNRLRLKMPLQSDPTCVYPPKVLGEKPSPARCRDKSSDYSTYVLPALPPGPITSIGHSTLDAVFSPYDGIDAHKLLYFVGKSDGSQRHYFSKSYAEHQHAIRYYLKKEKIKPPRGTTQP
ncbi:MAG: endolytic transglycosylase MltG [Bradymonadales bacterium]